MSQNSHAVNRIFKLPPGAEGAAFIVESIPKNEWAWVNGRIENPHWSEPRGFGTVSSTGLVVSERGFSFAHRPQSFEGAYRGLYPDHPMTGSLEDIFVFKKAAGFLEFHLSTRSGDYSWRDVRSLVVEFLKKGYVGSMTFRLESHNGSNAWPAQCKIFVPWDKGSIGWMEHHMRNGPRIKDPHIALGWDTRLCREHWLEETLKVCSGLEEIERVTRAA